MLTHKLDKFGTLVHPSVFNRKRTALRALKDLDHEIIVTNEEKWNERLYVVSVSCPRCEEAYEIHINSRVTNIWLRDTNWLYWSSEGIEYVESHHAPRYPRSCRDMVVGEIIE